MNDIKKGRKLDSMELAKEKRIIAWEAPEFIHYERGTNWYLGLFVGGAVLAALLFWLKYYLGFTTTILAIAVIFMLAKQKPKKRSFKLSADGFEVNGKPYDFSQFRSFFVSYIGNVGHLHLERTRKIFPPISALLVGVNVQEIEKFINRYLPENQRASTPNSDLFSKWFRF